MTFGNFNFLKPLTHQEIQKQIEDMLEMDLIPTIEYMENPDPHDIYWNLWRLPHEKYSSPTWVMNQLNICSKKNPFAYVRLSGYDRIKKSVAQSFIVRTPAN